MTEDPAFKGYIHDVGGPTANFRVPACNKQLKTGACVGKRCLSPEPCPSLRVTHEDYLALLRKLPCAARCQEGLYTQWVAFRLHDARR